MFYHSVRWQGKLFCMGALQMIVTKWKDYILIEERKCFSLRNMIHDRYIDIATPT